MVEAGGQAIRLDKGKRAAGDADQRCQDWPGLDCPDQTGCARAVTVRHVEVEQHQFKRSAGRRGSMELQSRGIARLDDGRPVADRLEQAGMKLRGQWTVVGNQGTRLKHGV